MFSFYQITITDFPSIKKNNDKRANATKYVFSNCFFHMWHLEPKTSTEFPSIKEYNNKERKRRHVSLSDHNDSRSFFSNFMHQNNHTGFPSIKKQTIRGANAAKYVSLSQNDHTCYLTGLFYNRISHRQKRHKLYLTGFSFQ